MTELTRFESYIEDYTQEIIDEKLNNLIDAKVRDLMTERAEKTINSYMSETYNLNVDEYLETCYRRAVEEIIKPQMRGVWLEFDKVFDSMRARIIELESITIKVKTLKDDVSLLKSMTPFAEMKAMQEMREKCSTLESINQNMKEEMWRDKDEYKE